MTGVLKRIKRLTDRKDKDTEGRKPCDSRSRDWSDAATGQGTPRIAGNLRKLEEARKDSP